MTGTCHLRTYIEPAGTGMIITVAGYIWRTLVFRVYPENTVAVEGINEHPAPQVGLKNYTCCAVVQFNAILVTIFGDNLCARILSIRRDKREERQDDEKKFYCFHDLRIHQLRLSGICCIQIYIITGDEKCFMKIGRKTQFIHIKRTYTVLIPKVQRIRTTHRKPELLRQHGQNISI
jgi:hypothetical protein